MADVLRTEELDKLVLAWLLVPRGKPSLKDLARVLTPFVQSSGASAQSVARQCLARLKARGDIEADTTWMLSPAGKEKALSALGIPALPKRPTWKWVQTLLVARGMGAEPKPAAMKALGTPGGLAAAVVQRAREIGDGDPLTVKQVGAALAWRELGVESTEPFTLDSVLAHIARKASKQAPSRAKPPKSASAVLQALATADLGTEPGDLGIRVAMVQRWMAGTPGITPSARHVPGTRPAGPLAPHIAPPQPPIPSIAATPSPAPDIEPAQPPAPIIEPARPQEPVSNSKPPRDLAVESPSPLRAFAERVLAAARASKTGRWGESKVFIAHVWDQYQRDSGQSTIDEDTFKSWLVRANQAGFLSLSRADLVSAMDPQDVARSEIASLGTTFHFVKTV